MHLYYLKIASFHPLLMNFGVSRQAHIFSHWVKGNRRMRYHVNNLRERKYTVRMLLWSIKSNSLPKISPPVPVCYYYWSMPTIMGFLTWLITIFLTMHLPIQSKRTTSKPCCVITLLGLINWSDWNFCKAIPRQWNQYFDQRAENGIALSGKHQL